MTSAPDENQVEVELDDEVDGELDADLDYEADDAASDELDAGYEEGDVNTVGDAGYEEDADYEEGDVNTVTVPAGDERQAVATPGGEMPAGVLTYLARSLADDPDAVVVQREDRRGSIILRLHVAPSDMGRVIGRRGRTAQAIRTLVGVAGARDGVQTVVDIVDD